MKNIILNKAKETKNELDQDFDDFLDQQFSNPKIKRDSFYSDEDNIIDLDNENNGYQPPLVKGQIVSSSFEEIRNMQDEMYGSSQQFSDNDNDDEQAENFDQQQFDYYNDNIQNVIQGVEKHSPDDIENKMWDKCPCLTAKFYQPYFNVTTTDIKNRVLLSLKPIGGDKDFINKIKGNPDLYGPTWILATWVVILTIATMIQNYLDGGNLQNYGMHHVMSAVSLIFTFGFGIPVLATTLLKCFKTDGVKYSYPQVICIYGYSQSIYIPAMILCTYPNFISQLVILGYSVIHACFMMYKNFNENLKLLEDAKRYLIFSIVGFAQVIQFFMLKFYYF